MLDFRLRTFLAVHRTGSFSKAAELLNLTQPAVSQHLRHLEDRFGMKLVEFRGRTLALTEAGEILRNYAAGAFADGARTEALMRARNAVFPLRFGATRTIGEYVLPPRLSAYLTARPEAEISMRVDNTEILLGDLREGAIDFAFIEGIFDRGEYDSRLFFRDEFIPVCSPGDELAVGEADFDSLLSRRLIVREGGSGSRLILERSLEGLNRRIGNFTRIVELGNLEAIKRLVADGLGIAFLYRQSVETELSEGKLRRIDLKDFSVSHDYSFVFLKNGMYVDRYLAFLDFCRSFGSGRSALGPLQEENPR